MATTYEGCMDFHAQGCNDSEYWGWEGNNSGGELPILTPASEGCWASWTSGLFQQGCS